MLSARITEEEADRFEHEHRLERDKFCKIEEPDTGPNTGELVIKMPCKYLLGKPMYYVSCRAYQGFRPQVCGAYLCKVAIGYKIGSLELQPALKLLRTAFWSSDATIFNWAGVEGEEALLQAAAVPKLRKQAKEIFDILPADSGVSVEELERFLIAKHVTPVYDFASNEAHFEFNMIMNIFDRDEFDASDLLEEKAEALPREERKQRDDLAKEILTAIRKYFKVVE